MKRSPAQQAHTPAPQQTLSAATLARGVAHLVRRDQVLRCIFERWGLPPLWARPQGFPTLVHIILEQQVSLASARAAYRRLRAAAAPLTPTRFLTLDDETLRRIGFSRQKTAYVRQLARALVAGQINLAALRRLNDDAVRGELTRLKGIGPWTAEVYLLMALLRPDAWPAQDLGLIVAVERLRLTPARPTPAEMLELGARWRPWRAVAARLLWHYYLSSISRAK